MLPLPIKNTKKFSLPITIFLLMLALLTGGWSNNQDTSHPAVNSQYTIEATANNKDHSYLKNDTFIEIDGQRSNLEQAVNDIIADADGYMAALNVSSDDQAAVNTDVRYWLYFLQDATESRMRGDHGILHVHNNWQKAKNYLATRSDANTEIYLAELIADVYHDTGYSKAPCSLPNTSPDASTSNHDKLSREILESSNTLPVYKRIFSENILMDILDAIGTHNSEIEDIVVAHTGTDSNLVALTLNLSDKCALAFRDKLPSVLNNCPAAFQVMLDYYPKSTGKNASEYNKEFLEKFQATIADAQFKPQQKESYLKLAEDDVSITLIKKFARMLFCYVPADCIKYNSETRENDIVIYTVTYGIKGENKLQRIVGTKLIEDLVPKRACESKDSYKDRIMTIYKAAYQDGGTLIDNVRGLRLTIKKIPVDAIPNAAADYKLYNIRL